MRCRWSIFALFALIPFVGRFTAEAYLLSRVTRVMIFSIAALVARPSGRLRRAWCPFGHAAFMGIGAYAVGILASHGFGDALVALPVALVASALFAWLTGIVCLRTKGVCFIMITLAFGRMAFFTASSLAPYGGDDGLTLQARSTIAGLEPARQRPLILLCRRCSCLAAGLSVLPVAGASRVSAGCFAARAKMRPAMTTLGYDVYRYQLVAYVVARHDRRDCPVSSWPTRPISSRRPTCRGSAPANC